MLSCNLQENFHIGTFFYCTGGSKKWLKKKFSFLECPDRPLNVRRIFLKEFIELQNVIGVLNAYIPKSHNKRALIAGWPQPGCSIILHNFLKILQKVINRSCFLFQFFQSTKSFIKLKEYFEWIHDGILRFFFDNTAIFLDIYVQDV